MNIFIIDKSYVIKKIKSVAGGWKLYPQDKNEKENNYNFLTIELDKVNGIDLDEIVLATNIINPIVDKMDFIDESYILDVISKERGV